MGKKGSKFFGFFSEPSGPKVGIQLNILAGRINIFSPLFTVIDLLIIKNLLEYESSTNSYSKALRKYEGSARKVDAVELRDYKGG
jgi:hypothetical protein